MQVSENYQVIVVGGGPGGIMAALASANQGMKTLLIERGSFLGGSATQSKIGPISPFHYKDETVVNGLPQEFITELTNAGGATGYMKCLNPFGTGSYVCIYNHETYKYIAQRMLEKAGVTILFYSMVTGVLKKDNCLVGVQIQSKFGSFEIRGQIVIDATGDGDVAVLAGEGYIYGDGNGNVQPSSAMFEMSNVDTDKLYDYILKNRHEFGRLSDLVPFVDTQFKDRKYFVAQGYQSFVNKAVKNGELVFGRENVHTITGLYPGVMHFNTARISGYDTTNLRARSESELDGRRQIESIANFMIQYIPGYEHAYISSTGNEVGVRESRHICGMYCLTGEDILQAKRFEDVIARGLFAVDIHGKKSEEHKGQVQGAGGLWKNLKDAYDIPYSVLVPATVNGLLLAGRCISADYVAFSSLRVQGTLMGFSQVAGIAAALCVQKNVQPRDLDVKELQQKLIDVGASPYRNIEKKLKEEHNASLKVKEFIAERGELITPQEIVMQYMG